MDERQRLLATLTPREREVLPLVVSGRLNKQVADHLGTVEKTIKVHRTHVMAKLRACTLADLVRRGIRGPRLTAHAATWPKDIRPYVANVWSRKPSLRNAVSA
jgi:DNA-binding CsgD family transcriptional regulator